MEKISIEERQRERLEEWQRWLVDFIEGEDDYLAIPYAAELLNDYYWRLALDFIKPLLKQTADDDDHFLHFYKIISGSEITIMRVLPLHFKNPQPKEEVRFLNAKFAWFVAISILSNWKIAGEYVVREETPDLLADFQEIIDMDGEKEKKFAWSFKEEHIMWLRDINPAISPPILSNSQTWRLFYLGCRAIEQGGKL